MPAWSVPGRYKVLYPRIRCQRVRISISVCSNICPMCREPVTFGGGITIENTGPGALGSALNSSSLTQYSAQRGSICPGSYALAISRAIRNASPQEPTHFHSVGAGLGPPSVYSSALASCFKSSEVIFDYTGQKPTASIRGHNPPAEIPNVPAARNSKKNMASRL